MVARGRVSVYDPKGEYQIVCEHLEPEGLGARQLAFDQLKQRLRAEGLFDRAPQAAAAGAAAQDRRRHLARRRGRARHHQGAAPPLCERPHRHPADARAGRGRGARHRARRCAAIGKVRGVDVVIVGRGGGSIEDLWAFNEEVVARAIAGCPVPTISAVGHETDVTIADFVADLRAPTPSAAAEMVVARKDDFCARIDRLSQRVGDGHDGAAAPARGAAAQRSRRGRATPALRGRVAMRGRHAAELTHELRARDARAAGDARARAIRRLRLTLETFDLRRRLGGVRTRLSPPTAGSAPAWSRRRHAARRAAGAAPPRGSTASARWPCSARGYAVCWNDDRTARHPRRRRDVGDRASHGDAVTLSTQGELALRASRRAADRRVEDRRPIAWIPPSRTSKPRSPSSRHRQEARGRRPALEASLQLYERGVHLSRFCHARLEEAERRIEILNERGELQAGAGGRSTPTTTRRRERR